LPDGVLYQKRCNQDKEAKSDPKTLGRGDAAEWPFHLSPNLPPPSLKRRLHFLDSTAHDY